MSSCHTNDVLPMFSQFLCSGPEVFSSSFWLKWRLNLNLHCCRPSKCHFQRLNTLVGVVNGFLLLNTDNLSLLRLKCKSGENMTEIEKQRKNQKHEQECCTFSMNFYHVGHFKNTMIWQWLKMIIHPPSALKHISVLKIQIKCHFR